MMPKLSYYHKSSLGCAKSHIKYKNAYILATKLLIKYGFAVSDLQQPNKQGNISKFDSYQQISHVDKPAE